MHRWVWDLHYPPPTTNRHDYPIAAIPHDTPRYPLGPTVLPGSYTVRLTVDGKSSSEPFTVKMDPRIKTPAAGLLKKFQVETRLASLVSESSLAMMQAGAIRDQLETMNAQANAPKDSIAALQKKLDALAGAQGGFFAPPPPEATISRINGRVGNLYLQVWQADAEPTSTLLEAAAATERESVGVLKRWTEFKNSDLPGFNDVLRGAKIPEIHLEADPHQEETQVDEE